MNFDDIALSYIRQAEERIELAKTELNKKNYHIVVRFCQEAVELLLKASLKLVGVEVPKFRDVGPTLKTNSSKFPDWFGHKIDLFASYSRSLRKERELSMYGEEETGTPPELLYSEYDANEALRMAQEVLEYVKKLYEEKKKMK